MRAGEAAITQRAEFVALSQSQQTLMTTVLDRLELRLEGVQATLLHRMDQLNSDSTQTIRASEAVVVTNLAKTAANLIDRQQALTDHAKQDSLRTQLLDALAFPDMNERRNMIEGRVPDLQNASEWIFRLRMDVPTKDTRWETTSGFADWLQSNDQLLWISGKPGSGKSTLMDCIYHNLKEGRLGYRHLSYWAGGNTTQILTFWFFRPSSSRLQKTLEGFLRSLCFQILDADPLLVQALCDNIDGSTPTSLMTRLNDTGSRMQGFLDSELRIWLSCLLFHTRSHVFVLVDGLDEIQTQQEALLNIVLDLTKISEKIKICCSSRPDEPYRTELSHLPTFRVQDYNHKDIETYCEKRLEDSTARTLANEVSQKSEGVFLWAYTVVEDLKGASYRGATVDELKSRLRECPTEMNDLFESLIKSADKFYISNPKPYLFMLKLTAGLEEANWGPLALELLLVSEWRSWRAENDTTFTRLSDTVLQSLNNKAQGIERSIVSRCVGLVESFEQTDALEFPACFPYVHLAAAHRTRFNFIHRSAFDFLMEHGDNTPVLQTCGLLEVDVWKRLMVACGYVALLKENCCMDQFFDVALPKSLNCGSQVSQFWTPQESSNVDALLELKATRLPSTITRSETHFEACNQPLAPLLTVGMCFVACTDLSLLDNMRSFYSASYGLTTYMAECLKNASANPTELAMLHQVHLLHAGRDLMGFRNVQKITRARWEQNICLSYRIGESLHHEVYLVVAPSWLHAVIAWTYRALCSQAGSRFRDTFDTLQGLAWWGSPCAGNEINGILICDGVRDVYLIPESPEITPAEGYADAKYRHIFRVVGSMQITATETIATMRFHSWKPPGLDQDLEIDAATGRDLWSSLEGRTLWSNGPMVSSLLHLLKSHVDELNPKDIGRLCTYHSIFEGYMGATHLSFSQGKFELLTEERHHEWQDRLLKGEHHQDFDGGPENDPILAAILKELVLQMPEILEERWRAMKDMQEQDWLLSLPGTFTAQARRSWEDFVEESWKMTRETEWPNMTDADWQRLTLDEVLIMMTDYLQEHLKHMSSKYDNI
jgi:hypothetical protein